MIYKRVILTLGFALSGCSPVFGQEAFPVGVWTDARNRMVVRIAPCESVSATFCGTVVQDNRHGRPTNRAGHMIIRDLAPARQHWAGQAYDGPMRLNFTLHPKANGDVKARLCLTGILCLNENLQRVSTLVAR